MNSQFYRSVVVVGDGIYPDIATCYLASQLGSYGVSLYRVRGISTSENPVTIDADHGIHVLNEDLEIDFTALMSKGVLIPKLVSAVTSLQRPAYFESYSHLKDDLPIPHYQVMARLIREGVATQWESASPLMALHHANKFHPELHQFYRGNVRPYGAVINVHEYSEIVNSKSLSLGVKFFDVSTIDADASKVEQRISALDIGADTTLRDAFYIDMTKERCLARLVAAAELADLDAQRCDFRYSTQPWVGNCLAMVEAAVSLPVYAPINYFERLYQALVKFVDFYPCPERQKFLASEYNRLQQNDNSAVADFLTVYNSLLKGAEKQILPESLQHRVKLFAESCQLSEDALDWAYPGYWPTLMIASGITPQSVPRRVQEIPLKYLIDWYDQRRHNIGIIVGRSYNL